MMGHQVAIIGQDRLSQPYVACDITFYPLPRIPRQSIKRFCYLPYTIWNYTRRIQADIYWIHTPELMWLGWYWALRGKKVVYDMHEDYYKTFSATSTQKSIVRRMMGKMIRLLEKKWVAHLDAVVYAETCYDNVLSVPAHKKYILRNKFPTIAKQQSADTPPGSQPYLLYTGTLATTWGVWETIYLWENLRSHIDLKLVIAGFTHNLTLVENILQYADEKHFGERFTLVGGNTFVPYAQINSLIRHCWAGTALYQVNSAIEGKVPTKFYEYMAYDKPLIYTQSSQWDAFNQAYLLGYAYRASSPLPELIDCCNNWQVVHESDAYSWKTEKAQLKGLLNHLNTDKLQHQDL